MGVALTIVAIAAVLTVCSILFGWKIKFRKIEFNLYWFFPFLGAVLCILLGFVDIDDLKNIFIGNTGINPLRILIIFLSFAGLSIFLDEIGLFKYIAQSVAKKCKESQTKMFFGFSITVALLTIFTSNDILILTFTPFLCHFAKHARIDVIPYVVAEFVMANVWSMFFVIGNPTNIYLSSMFEISFAEYALKMFLPTIVAGIVAITLVYLIFRKKLAQPISIVQEKSVKLNKVLVAIGVSGLIMAITLMAVGSYVGFSMWQIPAVCCMITYFLAFIIMVFQEKNLGIFGRIFKKIPYAIIPFLLSMTVLVKVVGKIGIVDVMASLMDGKSMIGVGFLAFLMGNLLNNIPMTILFGDILMGTTGLGSLPYTVIAASNVCAFLTPVGSLAGIMFMNILKHNKIAFSFRKFVMYGAVVSVPTLLVMLMMLRLG